MGKGRLARRGDFDKKLVVTDNGKKYIVTILVKRPNNDWSARTLIQEASYLIYNDIKKLN